MTGHCYSNRATQLIIKCCQRVYSSPGAEGFRIPINKAILNGAPTPTEDRQNLYFSPIEVLIVQCGDHDLRDWNVNEDHIKSVIKYIKGETEIFDIKL